jgi:hypothetical protein
VNLPPYLAKIVDWLRAGYPEGLPEHDYVALLAVLARRLSDEEVNVVTMQLIREGIVTSESALREAITQVTHQPARDEDIQRVTDRLTAAGWPVETQP